jgi:N6-adenosine-specific RNA methylase IME4/ParB-like chromosome segregation protein Spo0J
MARVFREVSIEDVVIPRGRRRLGDVTELCKSIASVGLLHPVVVTPELRLVAGLHRLRACEELGWTKIPVTVLTLSKLELELGEIDENLVRCEFSVLERAEHLARRKKVYEAIHPETRRGVAGGMAKANKLRGNPASEIASLAGQIASKTGVSRRAIELHVQIATDIPRDLRDRLRGTWVANDQRSLLQIARLDGKEQEAVVGHLSKGVGSVHIAKALVVRSTLGRVSPPTGKYHVIVADPPWPYEGFTEDYPSMTLDEIKALPIATLAEKDCILWLWTTNIMMRHVYPLLDAWGFEEQTILTWAKSVIGKGWYLRNQTEHCVVATKGKPSLALVGQSSLLQARGRERGRKPDEFFQLVDGLCAGSKLELFGRQSRAGWTTWGAESTKFDGAVECRVSR